MREEPEKGSGRLVAEFYPFQAGFDIDQSVRGCIVGGDIGVLSCIIVKQGEQDIAPLTTEVLPKRERS